MIRSALVRNRCLPALTIGVVVATIALAGCTDERAAPTVEELVDSTRSELLAAGTGEEVTDCVVDLAERRFRRGPLSEVQRAQLLASCEAAQELLTPSATRGNSAVVEHDLAFVGPYTYGDDVALDELWDRCEAEDGEACNQLFEQAPLDSDYERFGLTCGDRDEVMDCVELADDPTDGPVPAVAARAGGDGDAAAEPGD